MDRGKLPPNTLPVSLSEQTIAALHELARLGVYGSTPSEIARRFVDEGVRRFMDPPVLRCGPKKEG